MKRNFTSRVRSILHYIRWVVIVFNKLWMRFIPKDNKLVLISAWFGMKYSDSCKYFYEYLLSDDQYKAVWYTCNKEIYNDLISKKMPVVYSKSIKGIWYQIRSKVLVSSVQTSDFNSMFLQGAILLDLDHGFIIKQVGLAIPNVSKKWIYYQKLLRIGLDFWTTASSDFCCKTACLCHQIHPNQVVFVNKPRIDVFFDKKLREGKNEIVENAKRGRMAFVWMPTHRSCGDIEINCNKVLDLDRLQKVCEENNVIFIIKKHFYHRNEVIDTKQYPNIFDFTAENIDVQTLLYQADVLISDYSASYIDFLVLDRPILLYAYDLEEYLKKERGLYVPFNENSAGEIIRNKEALYKAIDRISNDPYDTEYAKGRDLAKLRYFDKNVEMGNSREQVKKIMTELINGTYKYTWHFKEKTSI